MKLPLLDRYILKSYLTILVSFFFILMFIFIIQTVWVFIDEFAGKGLDVSVLLRFLLYYSPKLIPLVLPLTILLASIMTFGNFAERYEFAAMKSAGISLMRAMRPLIVVNSIACLATFYVANTVIPLAEFKTYNLRKNLSKMRPALAIIEGMFNDIGESNIKVARKYGENDKLLENVIIHEKSPNQVNNVVIKAARGELKSEEVKEGLQLVLYDGYRYEEVVQKNKRKKNDPHNRIAFKQYTMNIDLRAFNNVDLNETSYSNTFKMQNINELSQSIDSLTKGYVSEIEGFANTVYLRTGIKSVNRLKNTFTNDSFKGRKGFLDAFTTKQQEQILSTAINNINIQLSNFNNQKQLFFIREKVINLHRLWRDDKFVNAYATLLLFFVGAPLGAIIRKGGFGLPIVVALTIFLTYHFAGTLFKNSAEDGSLHPFWGAWLISIVLTVVGLVATIRASKDKSVFDIERIRLQINLPINLIVKKFKK
ncbi:MAG: LptF/LptG family permease [Bacteroidetes bacterium]|nr:LptF/LptG family permease [Bacteroidota bacterium]MDA1085341.1 LptF/LptG family permease [Bacteroidota bacterium]